MCVSFKELFDKTKAPIVPLTLLGKKYYFLLDTGTSINILKQEFADSLSPELLFDIEGSQVQGSTGSCTTSKGACLELVFEDTISVDTYFEIMPIDAALQIISEAAGVEVVGLLGGPFLHENEWLLDFNQKLVWVNKP